MHKKNNRNVKLLSYCYRKARWRPRVLTTHARINSAPTGKELHSRQSFGDGTCNVYCLSQPIRQVPCRSEMEYQNYGDGGEDRKGLTPGEEQKTENIILLNTNVVKYFYF